MADDLRRYAFSRYGLIPKSMQRPTPYGSHSQDSDRDSEVQEHARPDSYSTAKLLRREHAKNKNANRGTYEEETDVALKGANDKPFQSVTDRMFW